MNEEQLMKNLIKQGESEQLEFKEVVRKDTIARVLCSFLNGTGGRVVIGVDENGNVLGVNDAEQHKEELEKYLLNVIIPDVPISITIENINNKKILMLKVWEGTKQPYIFDGSIFYRRGASTQKATSQEISKLIHGRQLAEKHWERQIIVGVELDDLDKKLIKSTIIESKQNYHSNYNDNDILGFLTHYGLYLNGSFTNACVVLFAKTPSKFIPQIRVRLTEYVAGKTDKNLIRDEVFEGNLFSIRDKFEKYINGLGVRSIFDDNQWKRKDFSFPVKALQEGIINALMHRDYSNFSSGVAISVYPDRFVISNSGQLPGDLEIKDLKINHRSHPVNPDIAHIVFLRGFIDKLGRGTLKVIRECKEAGLRAPVWKQTNTDVTLTFYGPKSLPVKKAIISTYSIPADPIDNAIHSLIKESLSYKKNVLDRLIVIIRSIYQNPYIKAIELQEKFNVSIRTIMSDLDRLNMFVYYKGSKKSGGYYLKDEFKNEIINRSKR